MNLVVVIGTVASVVSTVSFLPQVIKVFKTKRTKDLSFPSYFILGSGSVLWATYGFLLGDRPIVLTNTIIVLLVATILIAKLHYDKK